MARRVVHPYGHSIPLTRAFSLLFALAIIGMLYERMRDPVVWRWLTNEGFAADAAPHLAAARIAFAELPPTHPWQQRLAALSSAP